jgi:hypothetical protein
VKLFLQTIIIFTCFCAALQNICMELNTSESTHMDLATLSAFSRSCKKTYQSFNPNTFLLHYPSYITLLDSNDHMNALINYARQDNLPMFKHVLNNDGRNNRHDMEQILKSFMRGEHTYDNILHFYKGEKITPKNLFIAIILDNIPATRLFLKLGIDVNTYNDDQETPLHCACEMQQCLAVKLLLSHPLINVNFQNKWGQTPLHVAYMASKYAIAPERIINLLTQHPTIDVTIKDKEGNTASYRKVYPDMYMSGIASNNVLK